MPADWDRALAQIRRDRRSGASILLGRAIEAARLFLAAARDLPPSRLAAALERFTLLLMEAQPAMAAFLRLANTLWLGRGRRADPSLAWADLHHALLRSAAETEANLQATVRRAARLIRSRSLVLTYSNSTAVRMALWRAMAGGRRRFDQRVPRSRARDPGGPGCPHGAAVGPPCADGSSPTRQQPQMNADERRSG